MNYVSEEAAQEAELRYNAEDSTDSNTESETFVYTFIIPNNALDSANLCYQRQAHNHTER